MRHVTGDTLRRTTECPYEFVCLGNGMWGPCCVTSVSQTGGLVLASAKSGTCPYLENRADDEVCACPTHSELYALCGK
jgi:hypothetical protein